MDYSLTEIQIHLGDLINKIKGLSEDSYNQEVKNEVYRDYKELAKVYDKLTDEETKHLPYEYRTAAKFLEIGEKAEDKFNKFIEQFQKDNDQSLKNVISFIKSRKGFEMLNKKTDFSAFSDEELVKIFGGLFGVNIATECVASLKTERAGSVIGYALSGLFESDKDVFDHLNKNNENPNNLTLVDYIKQRIALSDFEAKYSFSEPSSGGLSVYCDINTNQEPNILTPRSSNIIDHCFIKHGKEPGTGTIIFGQSTDAADVSKQGYSFYKAYIALKELVNTKEINGVKNKYYGFKLEPYLMLGGRFVPDEVQSQEVGKAFKQMLPEATTASLTQLAQLQFYRLYANCPAMELVNVLPEFNIFLAGCDTMELYHFSEIVKAQTDEKEKNKLIFANLTKNLTEICNTVSHPTNKLDFDEKGKVQAQLVIQDIVNIAESLPRNFRHQLTQDEYENTIAPLVKSLWALRDVLEKNNRLYIASDLSRLNNILLNTDDLNSYNKLVKIQSAYKIGGIEWAPPAPPHNKINISVDDLSFVKDVAIMLCNQLGSIGKGKLYKCSKSIEAAFTDGYIITDEDKKTFNDAIEYFSKTCANTEVYNFLSKTNYLFDRRLVNQTIQTRDLELVKYLSEDLAVKNQEVRELISLNTKKLKI